MSESRRPTRKNESSTLPATPRLDRGVLAGDDGEAEPSGAPGAGGTTTTSPSSPGRDAEMPREMESSDPRQASLWSDAWRQLRRNPLFLLAGTLLTVLAVMAAFPQLFTNSDPRACSLSRSKGTPSGDAWFGYDVFGCDYYANVIYGARVSMIIGLLVVGGAMLIGVTLGALAGYYGGWFDSVIARITDVVYGLPYILGAILILSIFAQRGILQVALALIALSWMTFLRLFRSSVISIKQTDYVQAARALGATDGRIIRQHIVPNALAPVLVYGTIAVGGIIAAEATLSFLGIGLQLPAISWGLQIGAGQSLIRTAPHLLLFPSIFLSVTVLSFIMLGDALRDALDPKLR
jgi:oligopeptide transport system permease protein